MKIFSDMEQISYFEKFMRDLAEKEQKELLAKQNLARAKEMWEKRQQLDRSYREHPAQRTRYNK
jgi:mRNA-degrading endonuclease YafQ of YafQ-DinJ toxin-antitoxin module